MGLEFRLGAIAVTPLGKFLACSAHDRGLLLKTYGLLNGLRLGLWALKFAQLRRLVAALAQKPQPVASPPGRPSVSRLIWAINVCSHYSPGRPKCLARALTAQILLQRQGYAPDLRIGVAKAAEHQLEAHAWVEFQGYVIIGNQADLNRYQCLPEF